MDRGLRQRGTRLSSKRHKLQGSTSQPFATVPIPNQQAPAGSGLVEVEGMRNLVTSCTLPVAEGTVVKNQHTLDPGGQAGHS